MSLLGGKVQCTVRWQLTQPVEFRDLTDSISYVSVHSVYCLIQFTGCWSLLCFLLCFLLCSVWLLVNSITLIHLAMCLGFVLGYLPGCPSRSELKLASYFHIWMPQHSWIGICIPGVFRVVLSCSDGDSILIQLILIPHLDTFMNCKYL